MIKFDKIIKFKYKVNQNLIKFSKNYINFI